MMRFLFFALFVVTLMNCGEQSTDGKTTSTDSLQIDESQIDTSHLAVTSDVQPTQTPLKVEQNIEVQNYHEVAEPRVFRLTQRDFKKIGKIGFISLTDRYHFREEGDSAIIATDLRQNPNGVEYNYHKIDGAKRTMFLDQVGVSEEETVFIYNYKRDSLLKFSVKALSLIGMLGPYTSIDELPVPEYYFMIGFELPEEVVNALGQHLWSVLVCIEKDNPFRQGQAKPIIFEPIDISEDPEPISDKKDTAGGKIPLRFSQGEYDFYTYALAGNYYYWLNLRVYHRPSGNKVLDRIYGRGEGTTANALIVKGRTDTLLWRQQWTGAIFKHHAPAIWGMQSQSFGCEPIDFLDSAQSRIYLWCDNRH